jgi:hypothetical protein
MAVEAAMLGQQVRCPHCQQVVQTPAPVADAAPSSLPMEPAPVLFPSREEESIFSPPVQEDLFGDPKPPPTIEMPPEPGWPAGPGPVFKESPAAPPQKLANGPADSPPSPDSLAFNTTTPALDASDRTAVLPPTDWSSPASHPSRPAQQEPGPQKERAAGGRAPAAAAPTPWLAIILIPYAITMTVLMIYFWDQSRRQRSPLEELPDEGENRGVTKKGEGKISYLQTRRPVDLALSDKLRVPLRKTLRIGALEVTPVAVERDKLTFCYTGSDKKDVSAKEALVLRLHLKNISVDQEFCPTDPAFDFLWDDPKRPKPYTLLDMGPDSRFFGGAVEYPQERKSRIYVQGQENDFRPLGPGEERTTVICTDPAKAGEMQRALARSKGPLVWRVRLRRGLVDVRQKPRSATAVIGVEFAASDIR